MHILFRKNEEWLLDECNFPVTIILPISTRLPNMNKNVLFSQSGFSMCPHDLYWLLTTSAKNIRICFRNTVKRLKDFIPAFLLQKLFRVIFLATSCKRPRKAYFCSHLSRYAAVLSYPFSLRKFSSKAKNPRKSSNFCFFCLQWENDGKGRSPRHLGMNLPRLKHAHT